MYTTPIIWMLTWPVVIIVSYYAVHWAIKKTEHILRQEEDEKEGE